MTKEKIIKIVVVIAVVIAALLIAWFGFIYPNNLFKENEEVFEKAGKRYFEVNLRSLPKEEGRVTSVSLNTLVDQEYLEEVKIPYTNKACSIKDSTVKTRLVNGNREYYTYLKCDRYESKTDHEGPVITLNGDDSLTVNKGDIYEDAGVKSIKDNVDKDIDVSKVVIKNNVDTTTAGLYEVTYTIGDSLDNKTTKTRKVNVVENLSKVVKEATSNTNGYYQGISSSNYLELNNMIFRIVKVNSDDTVTLVSDDPIANVDYSANKGRFAGSSLDEWLNDYFYKLLNEDIQKLIVNTKWCDDVIDSNTLAKTTCDRYSAKRKVGILSVQDYNYTLSEKGTSYLNNWYLNWYSNLTSDNKTWGFTYLQGMLNFDDDSLLNVKPAITLKKNINILDGEGTATDPYIIAEEANAKRGDKLNTREIAEYISYSGYLFRISDLTSDDKTTGAIMDGVLMTDGEEETIDFDNEASIEYNPKEKGNIGYKINNDFTKSIDTNYLVNKQISVNTYSDKVTYKGKKTTKKYKVRLSAPSTFEVFSAKRDGSSGVGYWLLESSSKDDDLKPFVYEIGSVNLETYGVRYMQEGIKAKVYFSDDVTIKGGLGTYEDPYTLSK